MPTQICPWLGTKQDREIRLLQPTESHLCYAQRDSGRGRGQAAARLTLGYQAETCLQAAHQVCPFYREPPVPEPPALRAALPSAEDLVLDGEAPRPGVEWEDALPLGEVDDLGPPPRPSQWVRALLWTLAALALGTVAYFYVSSLMSPVAVGGEAAAVPTVVPGVWTATPPDASAGPTDGAVTDPTATPTGASQSTLAFVEPTATPTPVPGGAVYSLVPEAGAVGWVASNEARGNHFGDSYLYSGIFDGVVYHGAFQIDISTIPRGATIHAAGLELTGLDERRLGDSGAWEVRILASDSDDDWTSGGFQELHNAPVEWTLTPGLGVNDLAAGESVTLELPRELLRILEQRLVDQHYSLSFRLDGPLAGENSVFAWDSGYGGATQGHAPRLFLNVGAPPSTPLPTGAPPVVIVTSTPTPANVLTAAYGQAVATAVALTTGTFTPTPETMWTATPTPILIPVAELTPTPTPTPLPPQPADLAGKILFRSTRASAAGPWAMDPDGASVSLLTSPWPYEATVAREALSPDGTLEVYAGWASGQAALWVRTVGAVRGEVVATFQRGQVSSPVWSPRGGILAFISTASGSAQLWVVNADGSNRRQLTRDAWGTAAHPTFSPDGAQLAYTGTDAEGRRQIWVIGLDGSGRINLSRNEYDEWDPLWLKGLKSAAPAQTATGVATTGTSSPTLDSAVTATPTPVPFPSPRLTPTATPTAHRALPSELTGKILFRSSRAGAADTWAMDPDGGAVSPLTSSWAYDAAARLESLSPDGTQIVYAGQVDGLSAILIGPAADSGGPRSLSAGRPVVAFDSGVVSSPVWSQSGSRLAFVHSLGGTGQIWLVNPNGRGVRQLTYQGWGSASHPTFSPDGARLAYAVADAWGNRQIWTISVTGGGRVNVSNNLYDEYAPVWVK